MTKSTQLDHVALASEHVWDQMIRYSYHLSARWNGGPDEYASGDEDGFYFAQVELEGGTKLEFIQALAGPGSDFIRRFMDRNGPGPHHLTFKVPDLGRSIDAARAAGYEVVGINTDKPEWQEAFLHPKASHGIVIQLACQVGAGADDWVVPPALAPPRRRQLPRLDKVVHLVADLDSASDLFTGLLEMEPAERGSSELGDWATMTDGPWNLELVQPAPGPAAHWMGNRPGRLLQLCLTIEDPGSVPDSRPVGDGTYIIPPEHNLGTRLHLSPTTPPAES